MWKQILEFSLEAAGHSHSCGILVFLCDLNIWNVFFLDYEETLTHLAAILAKHFADARIVGTGKAVPVLQKWCWLYVVSMVIRKKRLKFMLPESSLISIWHFWNGGGMWLLISLKAKLSVEGNDGYVYLLLCLYIGYESASHYCHKQLYQFSRFVFYLLFHYSSLFFCIQTSGTL